MNQRINVTYIVSNIGKAVAFEWILDQINSDQFQLSFILLNKNESSLERYLIAKKVQYCRYSLQSKKDYPRLISYTTKTLREWKTNVVHCHMRDANFVGLIAAKLIGVKKRIYTRHNATYNHVYYPKSVKYDKIVNHLATDIVSVSANVSETLTKKEGVNDDKVKLIHHGFDLDKFAHIDLELVDKMKTKYNLNDHSPVVGVIARYIELKGHKYIIKAVARAVKQYPRIRLVLANTSGNYQNEIRDLLFNELPDNHVEIDFEEDLYTLYGLFDLFIHVPINDNLEAFGQTYVEALAAGVPSIFTLSGVASEFIKHEHNALVVDYKNADQIYEAIIRCLRDKELRDKLVENGQSSLSQFSLQKFITKLENLYA